MSVVRVLGPKSRNPLKFRRVLAIVGKQTLSERNNTSYQLVEL